MLKLHLGCGNRNFGPEWRHIDRADFPHIDSQDVTNLNYVDSSVDLIYASHLIAYFDRAEIIPILAEWQRVLKPGGCLRLATPDWDVLRRMSAPLLGPLYGKMETQGTVIMQSKCGPPEYLPSSEKTTIYHKTVYSYKELKKLLTECGFRNVKYYDHRKTEHANTGNLNDKCDDHSAAYFKEILISLNIQCYKSS